MHPSSPSPGAPSTPESVLPHRTERGFSADHLIPWQQLEPVPAAGPGAWRSLGSDPQFLAPCTIPAGWARVRLEMTCDVQGMLELYIDSGEGFTPAGRLTCLPVGQRVEGEFFVQVPRPARAVRLDPLDREGRFRLKALRVEPIPRLALPLVALRKKLRLLRSHRLTRRTLWNGLRLLGSGRLGRFRDKLLSGLTWSPYPSLDTEDPNAAYQAWRRRHRLTDADRERMRAESAAMADPPLISVLMPVHDTPEKYLRRAVESVLRQTYPHWELCVADDASAAAHVRPVLQEYARRDGRVRVVHRPERGHIAAASNSALALARGEYVALLDHDDELAEHALFRVARAIAADRTLDMLYSDEDKLEPDGAHVAPFFKPDWSPEYFLTCMYTCHLGVYRTALVRRVGGFRSEFDTAQDYDLALRVIANTSRIGHIPDVLYHWRKLPNSTAASDSAKPQAHEAARRALQSYLDDTGRPATVEPGPAPGFHRVRFVIAGRPRVSIIIPTACQALTLGGRRTTYLAECVESIRTRSTWPDYEIIAVHNQDLAAELENRLRGWGVRRVRYSRRFNLASQMNLGAAAAEGEHLVFLNDDVEVIAPDWLECLLEYSQQAEVGAVGAKLLFPNGRLQHVGVTVLGRKPRHPFYGFPADHPGYFCGNLVPRNYSAVTGACLMTRAAVFREAGGFSDEFPLNYNDIDYCLRVLEGGRRVVWTPYARLLHHESVTRSATRQAGVAPAELEVFLSRWGRKWERDPYYNPHLSIDHDDYRIRDEEGSPAGEENEPERGRPLYDAGQRTLTGKPVSETNGPSTEPSPGCRPRHPWNG